MGGSSLAMFVAFDFAFDFVALRCAALLDDTDTSMSCGLGGAADLYAGGCVGDGFPFFFQTVDGAELLVSACRDLGVMKVEEAAGVLVR